MIIFYYIAHTSIMKSKKTKKVNPKQFGRPNKFDINGSYTGTGSLDDLEPVQDADDL